MRPPPTLLRLLAWAAVMAVLALVFTAYRSPHLARDLATRLWSCF